MVRHGLACEGSYSASTLYVWSVSGKGVLGQAVMWIILIMMQVTMILVTYPECVKAVTLGKLGGIMVALNEEVKTEKSTESKAYDSFAGPYARCRSCNF